jgi:hypothetical protein
MEGISDRGSARLSRGPRGTGLGGLRDQARIASRSTSLETEEATGMSGTGSPGNARGAIMPHATTGKHVSVEIAP